MNWLLDLPAPVAFCLPFVPLAVFVGVLAVRYAWEGRRLRSRALVDVDGRRRERETARCIRPLGCGVEPLPVGRRLRSGPGSVGHHEIWPATAETPQDLYPSGPGSAAVPPGAASQLPHPSSLATHRWRFEG